eukprot:Lithocolla_globosa_v1_NODE_6298_length_1108_cov_3.746439.p1 type:complete len:255 gc:universal NODE_6298_length_1108_cov_3.746439:328-1092(+)
MSKVISVNVTFNGNSKFDDEDILVGGAHALAIRMLTSYFGCEKHDLPAIQVLTPMCALDCIVADHRRRFDTQSLLTVVLAVDDVGRCLVDGRDDQERRQHVTALCVACGQLLLKSPKDDCFVVTLMSGTISLDLKAVFADSGHPFETVDVPLLPIAECLKTFTSAGLSEWEKSREFRQLLAETGGVPRLIDEMFLHFKGKTFTEESDAVTQVMQCRTILVSAMLPSCFSNVLFSLPPDWLLQIRSSLFWQRIFW